MADSWARPIHMAYLKERSFLLSHRACQTLFSLRPAKLLPFIHLPRSRLCFFQTDPLSFKENFVSKLPGSVAHMFIQTWSPSGDILTNIAPQRVIDSQIGQVGYSRVRNFDLFAVVRGTSRSPTFIVTVAIVNTCMRR